MTTSPATRRRDLLAVLTVALLARLLVPIVATTVGHDVGSLLEVNGDSPEYLRLADSLTGGHFTHNGVPEVLRTPGYPLFVALGVFIGHPIGLTILLQVILGSLAAVTVYALAEDTTASLGYCDARRVALSAGLFYALDPLSVVYSSFVLSETLFTTLLLAHLSMLLRYFKTGSLWYVVMSGALAVAATFVRPAAMYWPFVVGGVLLFLRVPNRVGHVFARLVPAVVFLVITLTPLMLWTARNQHVAGYSQYSAAGDYNLYINLGSAIEGIEWTTARQRADMLAMQNGWTPAERYEFMRREGIRLIVSQPMTYLVVHAKAILESLTPGFTMYVRIYHPDYGSESTLERLFGGTALRVPDLLAALPVYFMVGLACAGQYGLALAGLRRGVMARNGVDGAVVGFSGVLSSDGRGRGEHGYLPDASSGHASNLRTGRPRSILGNRSLLASEGQDQRLARRSSVDDTCPTLVGTAAGFGADRAADNPTGDLQVATNRARADSVRRALAPAVLTPVPRGRSAALARARACWRTTRPSGAGSSATVPNWRSRAGLARPLGAP